MADDKEDAMKFWVPITEEDNLQIWITNAVSTGGLITRNILVFSGRRETEAPDQI